MKRDPIARATPRPFEGAYGNYLIKFKPQPSPDGRFLALAIVCGFETLHTLAALSPDLPSFATQAAAANAGWAAGTQWIDCNEVGEFVPSAARSSAPTSSVRGHR